ncbi:kinase [Bacillus xiapuensis]|uniref:Kinase n=1 Tax=Bacillus xiapuensis TaxID=2014075 RepID=A0ABU6NBY2_9BACI|nr:kinase [Bacillus xiapuensis]
MRLGKGSCQGTFGELVQGVIYERPFLITLPIPYLRSEAVFFPNPTASEITMVDSKIKALNAGRLLTQQFGLPGGGHLEILSNIPSGKGMASSSADIVAALKAISNCYSFSLTKEMISALAVKIEPTDGVMYDEVVAYDYMNGELLEKFGTMPPFILVGIDFGGVVDTIQFNQVKKEYSQHDRECLLEAYEWVRKGFKSKNLSFICKGTTISARVNQKLLPKPYFYEFEKLAKDYQGGIVVAHSGTVMGILIDGNITNRNEFILTLSREISYIIKNSTKEVFHFVSEGEEYPCQLKTKMLFIM